MAKDDVYSWRISRARKAALEHVAREERVSVAELLDRVTGEWIISRSAPAGSEDAEQARLRAAASRFIGAIRGGDPDRAAQARQRLRTILKDRRER
ncbi:MAG TPA: hypothetical protein VFO58_22930 [Vicinamibacterales bacterium]|nr:hypothetical protein [Vicinamibacterales bacterium]